MTARRLRLRDVFRSYLMPTAEDAGDRYVSPPPDPEDGPERFGVTVPPSRAGSGGLGPMLTAGEAMAVHGDHQERLGLWRRRHPRSAAVHEGVRCTEAGVVPTDEEFQLEGETDDE